MCCIASSDSPLHLKETIHDAIRRRRFFKNSGSFQNTHTSPVIHSILKALLISGPRKLFATKTHNIAFQKSLHNTMAYHILQNAQVTSNKMFHRRRHHFMARFSIPFHHIVCSVLLPVLASKTIKREVGWTKFAGFRTKAAAEQLYPFSKNSST